MTDSTATPTPSGSHAASRRLRWKPGAAILAVGIAAGFAVGALIPELTFQVIVLIYLTLFTLLALSLWWLFFSGVGWPARLGGLILAAGLAVGVFRFAVAEVTFDGAMRPRIRWAWQPSPREVAREWLARNAPDQTQAAGTDDAFAVSAADWPRFCGPGGDRVVAEPRPELDWDSRPPREVWRHPVGAAWSSFAIVGQRLFTQEQRGPLECVVCYDAATGDEVWRHEDTARYETPMGGLGPRATPTVTGHGLYALGATGILNCLDPVTGALQWQRNICADAGSSPLEWGMSGSPLVHNALVFVDAGGRNDRAVLALDSATGDIVWASGNHQAGYASPRIETIAGEEQLLIFHGEGLAGMDPDSGALLWEYPWTNLYRINVAQPIRFGDHIFLSSGYDAGCVLVDPTQVTGGRPAEVWPPNRNLKLKFNEAVRHGDFVYGLDDGILCCLEASTGERRWKGGRYRFGQVLLWDDVLIVQAEKGYVAAVRATPEAFHEITRFDALDDRTWNVPVVNRNRLFVRNADEAACYALRPAEPAGL